MKFTCMTLVTILTLWYSPADAKAQEMLLVTPLDGETYTLQSLNTRGLEPGQKPCGAYLRTMTDREGEFLVMSFDVKTAGATYRLDYMGLKNNFQWEVWAGSSVPTIRFLRTANQRLGTIRVNPKILGGSPCLQSLTEKRSSLEEGVAIKFDAGERPLQKLAGLRFKIAVTPCGDWCAQTGGVSNLIITYTTKENGPRTIAVPTHRFRVEFADRKTIPTVEKLLPEDGRLDPKRFYILLIRITEAEYFRGMNKCLRAIPYRPAPPDLNQPER